MRRLVSGGAFSRKKTLLPKPQKIGTQNTGRWPERILFTLVTSTRLGGKGSCRKEAEKRQRALVIVLNMQKKRRGRISEKQMDEEQVMEVETLEKEPPPSPHR